MPKFKNSYATFWVIFKQCATTFFVKDVAAVLILCHLSKKSFFFNVENRVEFLDMFNWPCSSFAFASIQVQFKPDCHLETEFIFHFQNWHYNLEFLPFVLPHSLLLLSQLTRHLFSAKTYTKHSLELHVSSSKERKKA